MNTNFDFTDLFSLICLKEIQQIFDHFISFKNQKRDYELNSCWYQHCSQQKNQSSFQYLKQNFSQSLYLLLLVNESQNCKSLGVQIISQYSIAIITTIKQIRLDYSHIQFLKEINRFDLIQIHSKWSQFNFVNISQIFMVGIQYYYLQTILSKDCYSLCNQVRQTDTFDQISFLSSTL
ncbi:hypothetical protein TTHERM_000285749 (macronuclear) [Tetrahymena thermophila SB210]|uniref:Uncharacterized protein n=1 Tax=Tetrahymena thermophila (strain SB210) TaxID=312017 RepID=W7XIZ6_TETTS|nr:hypothetical protein TTHERM_000285749 [Tetrahymena thermophila SB210]EWS73744.1 hypothetical protein TTHERM_000285749 [Tetrahymena thermophila SB210]|eukprot:XP_012653708.1 hypothetical protein TTHERM_000285749 [Tetrahymena thermophila SB210]